MLAVQSFFLEAVPSLYYSVAAFGSLYLLNCLFIFLRGALRLLRPRLNLLERYGEKSWALVTGSSEGIGREFAVQLAREGFNIILLARTEAKLLGVREEILKAYPAVRVEVVVADLGSAGRRERAGEVLPELARFGDISVLVNNAGMDVLDHFTSLPAGKLLDLLSLNCFALTALLHRFLPLFAQRSRATGRKCAIINVGSVAGEMAMPLHNIYSASKAYVNLLTLNLSKENPEVDWLNLKPAEVVTAMIGFRRDVFCVSTAQCVAGALRDLGRMVESNGALWHKVQSFLFAAVPRWLFNLIWVRVVAVEARQAREQFQKRKSE